MNNSELTKAGLARAVATGARIGQAPFGFERLRELDDYGRLKFVPIPDEIAAIHFILERRRRGLSYQAIADALNEGARAKRGGTWWPGTVRRIALREPFYRARGVVGLSGKT